MEIGGNDQFDLNSYLIYPARQPVHRAFLHNRGGGDLYVDGLRDVVWQKRGVAEVRRFFLVLAPLPPGSHHVGVSARVQGRLAYTR